MAKKFVDGATHVIIKAVTPYATYETGKVLINKNNHAILAGILEEPQQYAYIKLPLGPKKVVVLPQDLIKLTSFVVEYFDESPSDNVIRMDTSVDDSEIDYEDLSDEDEDWDDEDWDEEEYGT